MSSTRVNLVSLLALLFLVLVLAVTPEARQMMRRLAFWAEGVEEKIEASRRERKAAGSATPEEGRTEEQQPAAEEPPPPHVLIRDGRYFPEPGWSWVNELEGDLRVEWVPGARHPEHPNVIASSEPDQWRPAPGYDWVETKGVNDLSVVWVPGKRHPDHEHVLAAEKEGEWHPETGYVWVNDDPHDLSVTPAPPSEP